MTKPFKLVMKFSKTTAGTHVYTSDEEVIVIYVKRGALVDGDVPQEIEVAVKGLPLAKLPKPLGKASGKSS